MEIIRIVSAIAILAVAIYVAFSPRIVYAPQPRVVLYLLLSVFLAVLFGSETVAQFNLQLPGFIFVCTGAAALCFGMLWFLNRLSKPEEKIAVFYIYDESALAVDLQWKGAVKVPLTPQGLQVTNLVFENALVLIFPEQVGEAEIQICKRSGAPPYAGTVSYAGTRTARLYLGKELKLRSQRAAQGLS